MDLKTIKNLLNLIADSEVNEVEIEEGDFKIRVKKQADTVQSSYPPIFLSGTGGSDVRMPDSNPEQSSRPTPASETSGEAATDKSEADEKYLTIRSPIVGTFYRAPSPESDPFVNPGETVSRGDVLCIVEAMKIMNEIESEHSGKVVKILAENAQPVEYDQPLFLIEPS